mgnify:CR=1 FL=1
MNDQLMITPKTRILQLIETYPQLEAVLIGYVPAFEKLKNPILRKTVAKVATLQQAAAIGNVKVEDLINRLRKEVGQDLIAESTDSKYATAKPDWFAENLIFQELDARLMLAQGEHPVSQVMADLKGLPKGHIYKLRAPFVPAPLIDKTTGLSFRHWLKKESEELYTVYFFKEND